MPQTIPETHRGHQGRFREGFGVSTTGCSQKHTGEEEWEDFFHLEMGKDTGDGVLITMMQPVERVKRSNDTMTSAVIFIEELADCLN